MRKILKFALIPAAFAMIAGAGIATTAAPAKADVGFNLNLDIPFFSYGPPASYAPYCYWDRYYGRACY